MNPPRGPQRDYPKRDCPKRESLARSAEGIQ
jgi:hypothetical protein